MSDGYYGAHWASSKGSHACPVCGAFYHVGVSGGVRENRERVDVTSWGEVCFEVKDGTTVIYAHGDPERAQEQTSDSDETETETE